MAFGCKYSIFGASNLGFGGIFLAIMSPDLVFGDVVFGICGCCIWYYAAGICRHENVQILYTTGLWDQQMCTQEARKSRLFLLNFISVDA